MLVEGGSGDAGLFDESSDADVRDRAVVEEAGGDIHQRVAAALHTRVHRFDGAHDPSLTQSCKIYNRKIK